MVKYVIATVLDTRFKLVPFMRTEEAEAQASHPELTPVTTVTTVSSVDAQGILL